MTGYALRCACTFAAPRDGCAVQITFNSDPLYVHGSRTQISVVERVLSRRHRASLFCHYTPEGMPGLVQVNVVNPYLPRIELQVTREGVGGERLACEFRIVVARPHRSICLQHMQATRRRQVI